MTHNEINRFGSANWADLSQLKRAGLLGRKGAYICHDVTGKHKLRLPGDGSIAYFGGAGCGKSSGFYIPNLLGDYFEGNSLQCDLRGELNAVSGLAASLQGYEHRAINPMGFAWAPQDRCNPFDHLCLDNPGLISDNRKTLMNVQTVGKDESGKSRWWEATALNDACMLNLAVLEANGHTSPKLFYEQLMRIEGDLDGWCNDLERMERSRFSDLQSWAGQIMQRQKEGRESFNAPMSELYTSFAFMQDPLIANTLDGNDFSMGDLSDPEKKIRIDMMIPMEYIGVWKPALRLLIGSAIIQKLRTNDASNRVGFFIDECGQLGNFPSIPELYTFGRGAGCFAACAWQSYSQAVKNFGEKGAEMILGSAQCRIFKAVRDMESARLVSEMCGSQTLQYDEPMEQAEARQFKRAAARRLIAGESFIDLSYEMHHFSQKAQHQTKQQRQLITPAEVLNLPGDQLIAFISGMDIDPILGSSKPYFHHRDYAGLFLNNPYHDQERVIVKARFGQKSRRVVSEAVPAKYAHLPQYRSGQWRYVEGFFPAA